MASRPRLYPTLLALGAALSAAGTAQAQSSVSLYGLVDLSVGSFQSPGADATKGVNSGNMTTSFYGLKGSEDLGSGLKANFAVESFMRRTPHDAPERYEQASPLELLPIGVRHTVIHGAADTEVPVEMSRRYAAAADGEVDYLELAGVGHYELIDPAYPAWENVADALAALVD